MARWVYMNKTYRCSHCGRCEDHALESDACELPILNFKYCPHCGAKMDEEEIE